MWENKEPLFDFVLSHHLSANNYKNPFMHVKVIAILSYPAFLLAHPVENQAFIQVS